MSARVWTRDELNRVWPLPDGWAWVESLTHEASQKVWMAFRDLADGCDEVFAVNGYLYQTRRGDGYYNPHAYFHVSVTMPVILASLGLDSPAAIAAVLDTEAHNHRESRERHGYRPDPTDATLAEDIYTHAAEMLRRGTVKS